jgi:hypothetical protein
MARRVNLGYRRSYLIKLRRELAERFAALVATFPEGTTGECPQFNDEALRIPSPCDMRIAVDDFKTILAEVKKLA